MLQYGPTLLSAVASEELGQLCEALGHQHGPRWQSRLGTSTYMAFGLNVSHGHHTDPYCCMTMVLSGSMDWDFISAARQAAHIMLFLSALSSPDLPLFRGLIHPTSLVFLSYLSVSL